MRGWVRENKAKYQVQRPLAINWLPLMRWKSSNLLRDIYGKRSLDLVFGFIFSDP